MIHLRELKRKIMNKNSEYPFNIGIINSLNSLVFSSPVTIFIGENGTGKTTLLESIVSNAQLIKLIPEEFDKFDAANKLSAQFELTWSKKKRKGFYLKSQSFISYTKHIEKIKSETIDEIKNVELEYGNRSKKAMELALLPYKRTLHDLDSLYGKGLHKMSHGESYIELFKSRLVPDALYILDEPELSLSPMRQLALLSLIKEMVNNNCQFIIITHSPILMASGDASIYDFNKECISLIDYNDIEHVNLTRDFLNRPEAFLKYL